MKLLRNVAVSPAMQESFDSNELWVMDLLKKVIRSAIGRKTKASWSTAEIRRLLLEGKLEQAEAAIPLLEPSAKRFKEISSCLLGELAFKRRADDAAEQHFQDALATAPGLADAHYGLSLLYLARHDSDAAIRHAIFALHNGSDARYMAHAGLCHLERGNLQKAKGWLSRAVLAEANDKYAWNNLGIVRRALGNRVGARAAFAQALHLDADFRQATENAQILEREMHAERETANEHLAIHDLEEKEREELAPVRACLAAGNVSGGLAMCEDAIARGAPDAPIFALELARIHESIDEPQVAIDALRAFRVHHPGDARTRTRLGVLLAQAGVQDEASKLLAEAIATDANDVDALVAMADLHFGKSRFVDAGRLLERALALRQSTEVEGQLVATLAAQCRYHETLDRINGMEERQPELAPGLALFRLDALTGLGRHAEILPLINEGLLKQPHDINLRWYRATINLLQENYREGWKDYTYRNIQDGQYARMFPFRAWKGEPLTGKSLLIGADQGLGDQVMFASCLEDVVAMGPSRLVVEVSERIAPLIRRSFPSIEIVGSTQDTTFDWLVGMGRFDYSSLMGDLPQHFRLERKDFPSHRGYLVSDPEKRRAWRERLHAIDGGRRPRIGFSWKGGTERTRTFLRTIEIQDFDVLRQSLEATWVCLQYGDVQSQVEEARRQGRDITYWPESVADLDQFAALIDELDLIVTVCNTTVHFAGALGRPVWVLAPVVPEWRYGLEFHSMPWYPTSALYRQPAPGDWAAVLQVVAQDLKVWQGSREK